MGTNYYVAVGGEEGPHIGKQSAGWAWHWATPPGWTIGKAWADFSDRDPTLRVRDEYGKDCGLLSDFVRDWKHADSLVFSEGEFC